MAISIEQNWLLAKLTALTIATVVAFASPNGEPDEPLPCPSVCSCPDIPPALGLVCNGRNLTVIPSVNMSAHFVDFSGNPLTALTNQTLAPIRGARDNLEILVLKACAILSVDEAAFDALENLHLVDLSSNGITTLAPGVFTRLTHLSEMNLSENNITDVNAHWFSENTPLRILNLTANPIERLDAEVFTRLTVLEELRLDQCLLHHIDPHAFDGLFKLHTLNLSHNHLSTLTPDAITWLRELHTLELTANPWRCDCNLQAVTVVLLMRGFRSLAGNLTCAISDDVFSRWTDVNTTHPDCESQIRMHARKTTLIGSSSRRRGKAAQLLSTNVSRMGGPTALFSSHAAAATAAATYSPAVTVSIWCAVIVLAAIASYVGIYATSKMCVYATTKAAAAAAHAAGSAGRKKSIARRDSSECERALVDETAQFRDQFYLVDEASSDISISIDV